MFYTIYQIQNKVDNKIYIGKHQTNNLDDNYMGSGKFLKQAQEKYGLDKFEKTILHVFDNEEDMNAKEAELVTEEFCVRQDTYNICPGGKGGWGYVNQNYWTVNARLEHNKKYSGWNSISINDKRQYSLAGAISRKNGIQNNKNLANNNSLRIGEKRSNVTKIKMSLAQSGSKNSQYGTRWITDGIENKKIKKDDLIPDGWYLGRKGRLLR